MHPSDGTIRVMLVDDHQTMLWGLEKLIQGESPRMEVVATARSCDEALSKARQMLPDVIVLDLELGQKNALDIVPSLLSDLASRVLVLTGEREQATLDQAVLRGARGVLSKDASAEQVLKAIEKIHKGELWLDHGTLSRMFNEILTTKAMPKHDPEMDKKMSLTASERKIVHAIVKESGASNKAIAQRLFISEHTLRNHLTSIYHKLGVINRLGLYVYAIKHQLASPLSDAIPRNPALNSPAPRPHLQF